MENFVYLVGIMSYSGDQGDFPNTSEFPKAAYTELKDAEAEYDKLKEKDLSMHGYIREAYICKMPLGGSGKIEFLKGMTH